MNFDSIPVPTLAKKFGTPVYVYSRATIEERIRELAPLGTIRYAQKALPNISILSLMKKHGIMVDAVSAGELFRAIYVGYKGHGEIPGVVYTADILDEDAIPLIKDFRIPVNAGSPDMISQLKQLDLDIPIILRINPGFGHGHSKKVNTGGETSKHGIWHEQLPEVLQYMREQGLRLQGLHMHIGSGTDLEHLKQVARSMTDSVAICKESGIGLENFRTISAGGGLPIPYKEEPRLNLNEFSVIWNEHLTKMQETIGSELNFEIEPGRYLVAESGIVITKIRAKKYVNKTLFYLLDAGFDTLVRPAMYGAYHRISIVAHDGRELGPAVPAVVAGPLCESGDVFTQEEGGVVVTRELPEAQVGDFVVLHDTGAYGSAMASQYNSRLLAPEVLISKGEAQVIRKRQDLESVIANEMLC
jgi:diaminopimelate decarboxylase